MPNIIIKAFHTTAHNETLGFLYQEKIVSGRITFGSNTASNPCKSFIPLFTSEDNEQPKIFATEDAAIDYIKTLRKFTKTNNFITIIDYSLTCEKEA